ncbi:hypothetical protein BCR33DRAFT_222053 [Rhizoclosmatium globosum]|uniref:Uncharacterized protein n=1 Tax=Rhizoclosmatium globosum TaxID=329046 RepID=A0A1Y2CBN0_9FUNG|nr:hypothetical protein BCR33DRAFT_222053 [Rhizoclosmatium globosum]|eukprot:ORY44438.1 hypothetical protein BCR33DRAFT_222053 [Rhizoclosmatium globosum]
MMYYLLLFGDVKSSSELGDLSLSNLDMQSLNAIRNLNLQTVQIFPTIFEMIFKLCTVHSRFKTKSDDGSVNLQDVPLIAKAQMLIKEIIDFSTSDTWFKLLTESNVLLLREKCVIPWLQGQTEMAKQSLAPTRNPKKSSTPAAISRKTSRGLEFLRKTFTKPDEPLFDLSMDRIALSNLIESTLSGVTQANHQLRKMRLFLMFEEVRILSALKTETRLSEGYEYVLISIVAEQFLKSVNAGTGVPLNFWVYQMIPELPMAVLGRIVKFGQERIEASLNSISCSSLIPEEVKKMENLVEICCFATKVLVDETLLRGKDARSDIVDACLGLYNSILSQLEWFLHRKEDILQVEALGRGSNALEFILLLQTDSTKDIFFLTSLRQSLLLRLRVLGTLMPFIINRLEICNPLRLVESLILLSVSDLAENSDIALGDIVLDYAVFVLESPEALKHPDMKGIKLSQELQPKLVFRRSLLKRLIRIMPFQFDSVYMKNLVSTMDLTHFPASMSRDMNMIWNPSSRHCDPLRWVESRSYSLGTSGNGSTDGPEGESSVKDIGKNALNDTPISLSLFGATVATQPLLFENRSHDGYQGQDDETLKQKAQSLFEAIMKHTNK